MYTKQQLHTIANGLAEKITATLEPIAARTCLDCVWFAEKSELCNLWKSRPPARVIVNGCDSYKEGETAPF